MAAAAHNRGEDWTVPATRAEVLVIKADLGGQINRVDAKIDRVGADLEGQINRVDAKIDRVAADLEGQINRVDAKIDRVAADLGGQINRVDAKIDRVGADLEGQIKDVRVDLTREMSVQGQVFGRQMQELRDGLARQQVTTAWMAVGITTFLGALITVFEFLV
ncbi:MAG: hypothetical protein OXH26_11545 [bacterium]|nr:hypothetical protein [bacterium]